MSDKGSVSGGVSLGGGENESIHTIRNMQQCMQ